MTSSQDFRRPDDVSREEAKRLLELFDLCLTAERDNSSDNELFLGLTSAIAKLNLDEKEQQDFIELFWQASDGKFDEGELRRLEFLLQSVEAKDLSDEEHAELRRLEFIFTLALPPREKQDFASPWKRSYRKNTFPCNWMLSPEGIKRLTASRSGMKSRLAAVETSDDPFTKFKTKVLWEILGDDRPRTVSEFLLVLRDRGIILRHSP